MHRTLPYLFPSINGLPTSTWFRKLEEVGAVPNCLYGQERGMVRLMSVRVQQSRKERRGVERNRKGKVSEGGNRSKGLSRTNRQFEDVNEMKGKKVMSLLSPSMSATLSSPPSIQVFRLPPSLPTPTLSSALLPTYTPRFLLFPSCPAHQESVCNMITELGQNSGITTEPVSQ